MNTVLKGNQNKVSLNSLISMPLGELALIFLTMLLWIDRILLTYIRAVMMRLPIIGFMTDYLILGAYIVLIVFSVPRILKSLRMSDIWFLFATVILCVLNYVVYPDRAEILELYLPTFLFLTFPLYFIGLSLDFETVYPWLYKLSLLTIPAFTAYKLFVSAPMTDVESMYYGDMWSAYNLLPHVCVVALAAFKKPNLINIALTVMGVIMIASLGSRGPLLCAILAMVVYQIFFKKHKNPVLAYTALIIVAVVVMVELETIMRFLNDVAEGAGLSVRIFEKFFEGELSDSTSRDVIARQLYEEIAENPFLGHGMFSDHVSVGIYAHNIAIELWHSFGVIFGTGILGGIVVILLRTAKVVKKVDRYALLFLPLLFGGFIKLFLSGSILNEMCFFMLLGFSVKIIRGYKRY